MIALEIVYAFKYFVSVLSDNVWAVLKKFELVMLFPAATLFCLILFFVYYKKASSPLAGTTEWIDWEVYKPRRLTLINKRHPMEKGDAAPLAMILLVFGFLAFYQLGDTSAPQSFYRFTEEHKSVVIELDEPEEIKKVMFYTGMWIGSYKLEFSETGYYWTGQRKELPENSTEEPSPAMNQPHSHLFKWREADLRKDNPPTKYIRITYTAQSYYLNNPEKSLELGELALYDASGGLIPVSRLTINGEPSGEHELFDEQDLVPTRATYMNSMYFDEIYHGRTAYEFLQGVYPYETTHPPLGKEIIAASVAVFGMTPFGWRFAGALFGLLMLPIMFVFLKNIFGKTMVATCGTLLFGFDFMRFTQTRIATIDTYGVFFILLAFFFMYRFITTDFDAPFRKSAVPLMLSGVSFALGCASKWIVVYAGAGLAVLYLIYLFMLARSYMENDKRGFGVYLAKLLPLSVAFFIVVPVVVYVLSYIPYGLTRDMAIGDGMLWSKDFYKIIWDNQVSMFKYHGWLEATHPYSSWWYQWITDARPILYVYNNFGNMRSSFSAFGNPVVWWGGFIAMVFLAVRIVRRKDGKALFIVIGYLTQLLPWVFITRVVFIYHYFPSTLFLVLALAYVFNELLDRRVGRYRQAVLGYTTAAGALFILFYPAISGVSAPQWYFRHLLRWIPGAWPMG